MVLGWSCKLCLLSGPVGSGTLLWLFCHLSCTPRAFGMLRPPWAELCWLVPAVMLWSWVSLPVRGGAELCICRIWPCITQLTGSDRCKKLSRCVCIVGLSWEWGSRIP